MRLSIQSIKTKCTQCDCTSCLLRLSPKAGRLLHQRRAVLARERQSIQRTLSFWGGTGEHATCRPAQTEVQIDPFITNPPQPQPPGRCAHPSTAPPPIHFAKILLSVEGVGLSTSSASEASIAERRSVGAGRVRAVAK